MDTNVFKIAEHIEILPVLSPPEPYRAPSAEGLHVLDLGAVSVTCRELPRDQEDWVEITRTIDNHFFKRRGIT